MVAKLSTNVSASDACLVLLSVVAIESDTRATLARPSMAVAWVANESDSCVAVAAILDRESTVIRLSDNVAEYDAGCWPAGVYVTSMLSVVANESGIDTCCNRWVVTRIESVILRLSAVGIKLL
jgi:hypothetical protein